MPHHWVDWLHKLYRPLPNILEQGSKFALAHKWPASLHNPFRLRNPLCVMAGEEICSGP